MLTTNDNKNTQIISFAKFALVIGFFYTTTAVSQSIPVGPSIKIYEYEPAAQKESLSRANQFGCNNSATDLSKAPCKWDVFNISDLQPARVESHLKCKKIFKFEAMPEKSTRHIAAFNSEAFNQFSITGDKITSMAGFWNFWIPPTTASSTDRMAVKGMSLVWPHGRAIVQLPFYQGITGDSVYGKYTEKFVINQVYDTPEKLSAASVNAGVDQLCVTESTKYGKGTLASITMLNNDNTTRLTNNRVTQRYVCLFNNTYKALNDDSKMIVIDLVPGSSPISMSSYVPYVFFWSETSENLATTQADLSPFCLEDDDGDYVPNHKDVCPNKQPKAMKSVYTRDQLKLMRSTQGAEATANEVILKYELDTDGDGVGDNCDNCISVSNPDQKDSNNNGIGDACELDPAPVTTTTPGGTTPTIPSTCDPSNPQHILCDLVTDQEKTQLSPKVFSKQIIELAVPAFNFTSNPNKIDRECKLGKITYGNTLIADCKNMTSTDSKYALCQQGCLFVDNCYYKARFSIDPILLKSLVSNDSNTADYFTNIDKTLRINFEVFINSDYLPNKVGDFNANIASEGFSTTKPSVDTHSCTYGVDVSREKAELKEADCSIKVGGGQIFKNVTNIADYLNIFSKRQCN